MKISIDAQTKKLYTVLEDRKGISTKVKLSFISNEVLSAYEK